MNFRNKRFWTVGYLSSIGLIGYSALRLNGLNSYEWYCTATRKIL